MFYDSVWEAVQVRILTFFYGNLILFSMQIFWNHLAYLGIHN